MNWNGGHRSRSNNDCVCADHFTLASFQSKKRLKFDAVPNLFKLGAHNFIVLEESDESPNSSSTESRKSPHSRDEKTRSARQKRKVSFFILYAMSYTSCFQVLFDWAWPKLGNASPHPPKSFFGAPKIFLNGDTKERAPKGRCQARGVWGRAPQKILRNLTLFWGLFVRFEPLKFNSLFY